MCMRKSGYRRIIRCVRFGRWWTKCCGRCQRISTLYADSGRGHSIAPERPLRALLLQCFYSIRSERMLVEQINYSLAVPLVCGPRYGRAGCGIMRCSARIASGCCRPISRGNFRIGAGTGAPVCIRINTTVDGTLIEAWPVRRAFRKKTVQTRATARTSATATTQRHASVETDPEAKLYRKARRPGIAHELFVHVLVENRNGLIVERWRQRPIVSPNGTRHC